MAFTTVLGNVKATIAKSTHMGPFKTGRTNFERVLKMASEENKPVEMYRSSDTADAAFDEACTREKVAFSLSPAFQNGLMTAAGTMVAAGALGAIGGAYNSVKNRMEAREYENALQAAIRMSPALNRYGADTLRSYMPMIIKASPTVAKDPRLLANYLESMLDAEGHLNLGTFKELAGLENTVLSNNKLNRPVTEGLISGIGKGIGGGIQGFGSAMGRSWAENNI